MKYEYFTNTPQEHAESLTAQLRCTLDYLCNTGHITQEDHLKLTTKLMVVPVRNNRSCLQRVRDLFFKKDTDDENSYAFAIVELPEADVQHMIKKENTDE